MHVPDFQGHQDDFSTTCRIEHSQLSDSLPSSSFLIDNDRETYDWVQRKIGDK